MDTFMDSSWYFLRYIDPHNDTKAFDTHLVNQWMPVDGGVGFDTMLIGFSLDLSALPKLSCSTDRTYKCLGSQLWVFLSSEESKKVITVSQP